MKPGVSVIICTYNGARLLSDTLRHLALQQVRREIPWEVIIVDNASTDNSAAVVNEEWQKHQSSVPFLLLHQSKPGLTYARELGYAHSKYEYILMCDDDNWLAPNYIDLVFDLMEQYPNIGVLGGHGELEYEEEPPYFATQLRLFANGAQAPASGKVTKNIVYGAGCVLRKSAYEKLLDLDFKPLLTDRVAASLSSGGDYEVCYALALIGYDIWYDSRLSFKHYMVKERQTWKYYVRYFKESTKCFEVLDAYEIIVNNNSRSQITFCFFFLKSLLYYVREMATLTYKQVLLRPYSDDAMVNLLRIISCKTRISSYKKFFTVRKNFKFLLDFVEHKAIPKKREVNKFDTLPQLKELEIMSV